MPVRVEKYMNAAGGLISNVGDMIKYMDYHLQEQNEIVATSHQKLWDGKYGNYEAGLFWQIENRENQPEKVFQNGGAFGTSCWMTLIPSKKQGLREMRKF